MVDDPSNIEVPAYHYIHILDLSTYLTRLLIGPLKYVCPQNERIVVKPTKMISVPALMYCIVENPVVKNQDGEPIYDELGQIVIRMGDFEYRFEQEPFPLYPGENLKGEVRNLLFLLYNEALHLKALMDFHEGETKHKTGDMWLFEGPGLYYPRKEVKIVKTISALSIKPNTGIILKALCDFEDRNGNFRVSGESWLVSKPGSYFLGVHEEFIETRDAHILSDTVAIQIQALETHTDIFNKHREIGDKWLVTHNDTDCYIVDVNQSFEKFVHATVLRKNQFCIVIDPVDENGEIQFGKSKLICGENRFFLQPEESLKDNVQDIYVLQKNEGLVLRANENFVEESLVNSNGEKKMKIARLAGDKWLLRGPLEYIPPLTVDVICKRTLIPLNSTEGIYVRNILTGHIRAVIGQAYMLDCDEELWEKKLPKGVIDLLNKNKNLAIHNSETSPNGDNTEVNASRIVTFQVPHNSAVQIYDYRNKRARVEFGPNLVMLEPDEQFTLLNLSGGKPKRPNVIKSLCLSLGPNFCTDIFVVKTADHARLSLQLSYNWLFDVPTPCNESDATKLFSVPDFVGDICRSIASRIRGTVASVQFEDFHKHSSRIIRASVFGFDEEGKIRDRLIFPYNNLHITGIDIQSVEPVDQRTRDSLQKSIELAIAITIKSQEAAARYEAERLDREAKGRLELQKIQDEAALEVAKQSLIEKRLLINALECTGQAKAEAESHAQANLIQGEAAITSAKLYSEAIAIETNAELERLKLARESELDYLRQKNKIKLAYKLEELKIQKSRFISFVKTIGSDTYSALATSKDNNFNLPFNLNLRNVLISDDLSPKNILNTTNELIRSTLNPSETSQLAIQCDNNS